MKIGQLVRITHRYHRQGLVQVSSACLKGQSYLLSLLDMKIGQLVRITHRYHRQGLVQVSSACLKGQSYLLSLLDMKIGQVVRLTHIIDKDWYRSAVPI
jgi:hypothetical protein